MSTGGVLVVVVLLLTVFYCHLAADASFIPFKDFIVNNHVKNKTGHILAVRTCASGYIYLKGSCRKLFRDRQFRL
ncbi:uncharacterized protein LOC143191685 isoform X3 [Rhynchophorus ferrugineus]|uniref:uncharacterized protein LOC143191685 isoform X3 n=1 Tax=Rhynchophorus ferrugineus TaxID=354439 RepID=UPI003FCDFE61